VPNNWRVHPAGNWVLVMVSRLFGQGGQKDLGDEIDRDR
jgi:hypothetical protein